MQSQPASDIADPARALVPRTNRHEPGLGRIGTPKPDADVCATPAFRSDATRTADCGHRLRQGLADAIDEAIAQLGVGGHQRHRGIHLGRKALRRARAALQMAGPGLTEAAHDIDTTIKRECRRLSDARDAQARLETLQYLHGRLDQDLPGDALAELRRVLVQGRAAAVRKLLRRDPGLATMRGKLSAMRNAALHLDWTRVERDSIVHALARSAHRAGKAARAAQHSNSEKRRHHWRRRLRRWSSQLALFDTLSPGGAYARSGSASVSTAGTEQTGSRSMKKISALAHRLGREHDLHVLADAVTQVDGLDRVSRRLLLQQIRAELRGLVRRCRA